MYKHKSSLSVGPKPSAQFGPIVTESLNKIIQNILRNLPLKVRLKARKMVYAWWDENWNPRKSNVLRK